MPTPDRVPCLGVDVGNVIIDHAGYGTTKETFDSLDFNLIPPVEGVIGALTRLNKLFNGNIFSVYKATDVADEKMLKWFEHHRFSARTGIPLSRVHRTTDGRNKYPMCERYGATHFVDDRLEVLGHLVGKVNHLYLFRPQPQEITRFAKFRHRVQVVKSWNQIEFLAHPR